MSEHHTLKDILASVGTTWLSGRGAIGRLPELLVKRAITHVFLIADEHTYAAAGEIVTEQLANADIKVTCYRFADEHLEPNESAVGLPKTMREIGLDEHLLPMSFMATKDIRDKYVLSRLCHDLGVTDELVQG